MAEIVLFAIGSPLVVDYVESARRAAITIHAGVRNFDGPVYTNADIPVIDAAALTDDIRGVPYLVPLFTPGHRQRAVREAIGLGFREPGALIDPTSVVPDARSIGSGCFINGGCSLGGEVKFGDFVLVNRGATIGHHAQFADFVSIGPGATIAGMVRIGTGSVVGAGAVVLPEITIGRNAVVGAGAVVTRDVADETILLGNPASVHRSGIGGYKGIRVD